MFLAGVAHPVERHLAKVEVASSSLVTRSIKKKQMHKHLLLFYFAVTGSKILIRQSGGLSGIAGLDGDASLRGSKTRGIEPRHPLPRKQGVARHRASYPLYIQRENILSFFKKGLYKSDYVCYNPLCSGPVVQSVSTPACHAGGRRFESVRGRQKRKAIQKDGFSFLPQRTRKSKCDCPVDSRWFPARREPLHNVSSPFWVAG